MDLFKMQLVMQRICQYLERSARVYEPSGHARQWFKGRGLGSGAVQAAVDPDRAWLLQPDRILLIVRRLLPKNSGQWPVTSGQ